MRFSVLVCMVLIAAPAEAQFTLAAGSACSVGTGGAGKAHTVKDKSSSWDYSTSSKISDAGATLALIGPIDSCTTPAFFSKGEDEFHKSSASVITGGTIVLADSEARSYGTAQGDPSKGGGSYASGGRLILGTSPWTSFAKSKTAYTIANTGAWKLKTTSKAGIRFTTGAVVAQCLGAGYVINAGPGLAFHEMWGHQGEGTGSYTYPTVYAKAVYYDIDGELQNEDYSVTPTSGYANDDVVGYGQEWLSDVTINAGVNMPSSESSSWTWGASTADNTKTVSYSQSSGWAWGSAEVKAL